MLRACRECAPRGARTLPAPSALRRGCSMPRSKIQLKRAYAPPAAGDGVRVLVDRLWPRGLSKSEAAVDRWLKELAPSAELRRWFGHDPARWEEFRRRYKAELAQATDRLD